MYIILMTDCVDKFKTKKEARIVWLELIKTVRMKFVEKKSQIKNCIPSIG